MSNKRFALILLSDLTAASILFFVLFPGLLPGRSHRIIRRPNVIFIVLDAARADHFSCYGYKKITTPNIDKIAERGAVFLNNFSPGTHTLSSIPRLLSSRYFSINLFQHDLMRWGSRWEFPETIFNRMDDQQILLPEIIANNGYRVIAFHNHGCCLPNTELGKTFDQDYYCFVSKNEPKDEQLISGIISWIEKNKASGQPFFIYYHIMSPHEPYPQKSEDHQILSEDSPAVIEAVRDKFHQREKDTPDGWSKEELRILHGLYDGNLLHSDRWIGILDEKLHELDLDDNTLMIITSDHGERLGEHGSLGHAGPPWDALTHIPLIMRYPHLIPPRIQVSGFTESIDIMPTILDICNIPIPDNKAMDGVSLLSIIHNPQAGKKAVFTDSSIRTDKYKYIIDGKSELLYDLENDPGEEKNIASHNPELTMNMGEMYQKAIAPYQKRFNEAKTISTPEFSFYYSSGLNITPNNRVEKIEDIRNNSRASIENLSDRKSWVLNDHKVRWRLFCLPGNGTPPPITLSANIPNGKYQISILVESPLSSPCSPAEFGLLYRFDQKTPFQLPGKVNTISQDYHYLDLGEGWIRNTNFSMEMNFHPPDNKPYIIRHVKFAPIVPIAREAGQIPEADEIRKRRDSLKALGYL